jgi:hypothetical protein
MTRLQVCKHQVCDYCGERFGTVTQRWWGNKFCKRTCKNAYLRENGAARLAAALAVAMLMLLLLASANAAPSEEQPPAGVSLEFNKEDGTVYIDLSGPIVAGTADDVRAALDKYRTTLNRVVLFLDSAGGRVDDGDRVIEMLNQIKLRHQLITVVPHGKLCASMCPARRGSFCGAGKYLALPRGSPTTGKRRTPNRYGGDVAVVPQILRSRRGPNALAQKSGADDRGSRPVANRRRPHQRQERHHPASARGPHGA